MLKTVALGAIAAAALVSAAPASAGVAQDTAVVRISLAGKTAAQVRAEITAAAETVCGARTGGCVIKAASEARRQYAAITRANRRPGARQTTELRVEVLRSGVYAVRVPVKGRSLDQVDADIRTAAKAVCKADAVRFSQFNACVDQAVRKAREQLAAVETGRKLARA